MTCKRRIICTFHIKFVQCGRAGGRAFGDKIHGNRSPPRCAFHSSKLKPITHADAHRPQVGQQPADGRVPSRVDCPLGADSRTPRAHTIIRSAAITSPRSHHVRIQDEGRRKEDEVQDHTGSVREPSARSPLSTAQYFLPKKDANKLNGYRRISGGERKEGVVKVVELNKLLSVGEIFQKKKKKDRRD